MKTTIVKKDNLTNHQSGIWDAVTASQHSLNTICKRSGYSYQSFKNWMQGVYEPKQFAFDSIIECINIMESEPPKSIDWKTRKSELVSMKLKGMTNKAISLRMNTTRIAIERASKRFML
jgi:hypothetical protein